MWLVEYLSDLDLEKLRKGVSAAAANGLAAMEQLWEYLQIAVEGLINAGKTVIDVEQLNLLLFLKNLYLEYGVGSEVYLFYWYISEIDMDRI